MLQDLYTGYLTESKLGKVLHKLFPNDDITPQFCFNDYKRLKFDYAIPSRRIVIEFDGPYHFTKPNKGDTLKQLICESEKGWEIIRIPYFIQLTPQWVEHLFNVDTYSRYKCDFKTGFVSQDVVLPSEFCSHGLKLMMEYVEDLYYYDRASLLDMYNSLIFKICQVDHRIETDRAQWVAPDDTIDEIYDMVSDMANQWIDIYQPVKIICKTHGPFMVTPEDHFNGIGCPDCN